MIERPACFEIPDEQILEARTPRPIPEGGTVLERLHPDPHRRGPGFRQVHVERDGTGAYDVTWFGIDARGRILVTGAGIERFGAEALGTDGRVPLYVLLRPDDPADRPWWVPEGYAEPTITCDACGDGRRARDVLIPNQRDDSHDHRYCRECWLEDDLLPCGRCDPPSGDDADALRDRGRTDPGSVTPDVVRRYMTAADAYVAAAGPHAAIDVIERQPDRGLEFLEVSHDAFKREDESGVQTAGLYCLADLAELYPRELAAVADEVIPLVEPDVDPAYLEGGLPYIAGVAQAAPEAVLDAVPRLVACYEADAYRELAAHALRRIATHHPEAVMPVADAMLEALGEDRPVDLTLAAVGTLARTDPELADEAIPLAVGVLDSDRDRVRTNAAGVLAELAPDHPERVGQAIDALVELCEDRDKRARQNAARCLAQLARTRPEAVLPVEDALLAALEDDHDRVRESACVALGALESEAARDRLARLYREEDPEEGVRWAAREALDRIEPGWQTRDGPEPP